ncbi:HEAT repeat domain-containing protein [Tuwongella immobilis]|uniref:Pbs lyase n=1 Tax=Tuwongella immobilis TaxID=692036 RepID=A0A6C2YQJ9_9BACT|nr:HEAT repeat domain-containing protein [Tuwongella immobilis]VIP03918.1 pbs lyase : [Tuwongella immobilis]VTS05203.1 pbs lyase : [Tuwongella immobilis]
MGIAGLLIGTMLSTLLLVVFGRRRKVRLVQPPKPSRSSVSPARPSRNLVAVPMPVMATAHRAPAVARQHLDLLQGGLISESTLESTKSELSTLLEQGKQTLVESRLQAGLQYVVQVRALAEIGTEAAGRVLERQIDRRLSDDPLEQAWYRIDLAHSLRQMRRRESLPRLLESSATAIDEPLCHLWAAELVGFPGFGEMVLSSNSVLATHARRVLTVAMEGFRFGTVPLSLLVEAKLGEVMRRLFQQSPTMGDPLTARVALEVLRQLRRVEHVRRALAGDPAWAAALDRQFKRLASIEAHCRSYLERALLDLPERLPIAAPAEQVEILLTMHSLRCGHASLIPLVMDRNYPHRSVAMSCLAWASDPKSRDVLVGLANQAFPTHGDFHRVDAFTVRDRLALLRALHRHGTPSAEKLLLRIVRSDDPTFRLHAIRSLGWNDPTDPAAVVGTLQQASLDPHPEIRQRAVAALARLGDRAALQEVRERLAVDSHDEQRQGMQLIIEEGLSWLWPDLDRLADAEDPEVAFLAREALEQMREDCLGPLA